MYIKIHSSLNCIETTPDDDQIKIVVYYINSRYFIQEE